jgi:hypothetical protein
MTGRERWWREPGCCVASRINLRVSRASRVSRHAWNLTIAGSFNFHSRTTATGLSQRELQVNLKQNTKQSYRWAWQLIMGLSWTWSLLLYTFQFLAAISLLRRTETRCIKLLEVADENIDYGCENRKEVCEGRGNTLVPLGRPWLSLSESPYHHPKKKNR